jgi:hypothetical protein
MPLSHVSISFSPRMTLIRRTMYCGKRRPLCGPALGGQGSARLPIAHSFRYPAVGIVVEREVWILTLGWEMIVRGWPLTRSRMVTGLSFCGSGIARLGQA